MSSKAIAMTVVGNREAALLPGNHHSKTIAHRATGV